MMNDNIIGTFIVGILGAAVILAIGLIVLGEFRTSIGNDISYTSVLNESVVYTNATVKSLTYAGFALTCNTVRTHNITNNIVIGSGNYTCNPNGITFTNVGGLAGYNTSIYIDYGYKVGNAEYNVTGVNITKLATVPTWIGIVITVALAFIVLGYFYSRNS